MGFSPVGLDEPYRVFTAKDPIGFGGGDTDLYGYSLQDPVNGKDLNGLWTLQIGGSFDLQLGLINITISGGIAIDSSGDIGTYFTGGGGIGAGAHVSGGLNVSASNAKTICDLSKTFAYGELGGGWGPDAEGTFFSGPSNDGWVNGGGVTVGAGLGAGGAAGLSYTHISPLGKLW